MQYTNLRQFFPTFLLAFLGVVFLLCTPLWAFQNEPVGFRENIWGTDISEISRLEHFEPLEEVNEFYNWKEDGIGWANRFHDDGWKKVLIGEDVHNFIMEEENLTFGSADLIQIVYTFKNGSFQGVTLLFKGTENFDHIVQELFNRYGKGKMMKVPPVIEAGGRHQIDTFWEGDISCILLRRNHIFLTKIIFGYLQIMSEGFFRETESLRYQR